MHIIYMTYAMFFSMLQFYQVCICKSLIPEMITFHGQNLAWFNFCKCLVKDLSHEFIFLKTWIINLKGKRRSSLISHNCHEIKIFICYTEVVFFLIHGVIQEERSLSGWWKVIVWEWHFGLQSNREKNQKCENLSLSTF